MRRYCNLRMGIVLSCVVALIAASLQASAQTRAKRIVILGPVEEPRFSEMAAGLKRGLRDHGYTDAVLDITESKVPRGDQSAAHAAVETAVRGSAAVLFAVGSELARVARRVSSELPIVFITPGDPVAAGLVTSFASPGNNMTAMTFEFPQLSAKRLEILKELAPGARRVFVLYDPRDASPRQGLAAAREAAPNLGITLVEREVRNGAEVARGLEALAEADALLTIPGGVTSAHYADIIHAAHSKRLPTVFHSQSGATAEALASYGASDANIAREAARLVDKILKGEKAGELPVERPTKLHLVINLKIAKALGITVPPTLLARADEVIE